MNQNALEIVQSRRLWLPVRSQSNPILQYAPDLLHSPSIPPGHPAIGSSQQILYRSLQDERHGLKASMTSNHLSAASTAPRHSHLRCTCSAALCRQRRRQTYPLSLPQELSARPAVQQMPRPPPLPYLAAPSLQPGPTAAAGAAGWAGKASQIYRSTLSRLDWRSPSDATQ